MIGADQHAGVLGLGVQQGLQAGKARKQIVQARAGDEVTMQANYGGALGVVKAQFEVQHHIGDQAMLTAELIGEQCAEVGAFLAGDLRQNRR